MLDQASIHLGEGALLYNWCNGDAEQRQRSL